MQGERIKMQYLSGQLLEVSWQDPVPLIMWVDFGGEETWEHEERWLLFAFDESSPRMGRDGLLVLADGVGGEPGTISTSNEVGAAGLFIGFSVI